MHRLRTRDMIEATSEPREPIWVVKGVRGMGKEDRAYIANQECCQSGGEESLVILCMPIIDDL
jgi:hypothetical protein